MLGWSLIRMFEDGTRHIGRIVETEAYPPGDPASHAFRGRTSRNQSMFEPAGTAYIYRSYGVHWCFNIVTGETDVGEAVLVRGLDGLEGCDGPGRLCRTLGIDIAFDGIDLLAPNGPVRIIPPSALAPEPMIVTTRIGITKAADNRLRFYLAGSPGVSRRDVAAERLG
jgi:DNA-3-methyladenine glycosylase